MRAVQKQPLNSATEYKNLRAKVDKLMEKINRKKSASGIEWKSYTV